MFKLILKILMIFLLSYTTLAYSGNYKGEKVSLVFKDADLKNVLMLFAEYENKNFLIDEDVKGTITIRLKNVPWDQALKIILNMKNLEKIEDGNVVRIVSKEYIQKKQDEKKRKELEKIKEKERKKELAPLYTKIINVNFAKVSDINSNISSLLSSRGKLISDTRTNSFIITDIEKNMKEIEKVIKILDKPTPQVIIEAKIIVIKNTASKELGIQWGGSFVQRITSKDFFYGITGGSTGSTDITNPTTSIQPPGTSQKTTNYTAVSIPGNYVVNAPTVQSPVGGLGLIFGKWGYYNLSVKLTALKSKNMAKEISSPKVIALDNEKAVIEQGQEIPYKTVSDQGTKTEFKDAKLKLEVTPHITPNKMVLLDLSLSKDSIGQQTTDGPAINTQEVKTKLLLKNGETAVIGGIISNAETKGQDSVPFFSDLPIVGFLFKNNIKSNIKGELLIFITPHVVERSLVNFEQEKIVKKFQEEKKANEKHPVKSGDNLNKAKVVKNLKVRQKPLLSSKVLSILKKGRIVKILQRKDRPWYYIDFKGIKGYVFYKYLKELK
jgi:type IV pilus assembly protein PilQ